MFREMRRHKQLVSDNACRELLKSEKRGVLSVIGDDGYPYGVPMNFYYDEAEWQKDGTRIPIIAVHIQHMTGKLVHEK